MVSSTTKRFSSYYINYFPQSRSIEQLSIIALFKDSCSETCNSWWKKKIIKLTLNRSSYTQYSFFTFQGRPIKCRSVSSIRKVENQLNVNFFNTSTLKQNNCLKFQGVHSFSFECVCFIFIILLAKCSCYCFHDFSFSHFAKRWKNAVCSKVSRKLLFDSFTLPFIKNREKYKKRFRFICSKPFVFVRQYFVTIDI